MTDLQEKAMRMALEALDCLPWQASPIAVEATKALRTALAQPEQECIYPECETGVGCDGPCGSAVKQEPVAWICRGQFNFAKYCNECKPLYAQPVDTVNTSQEPVTWAFREHLEALGVDFSKPCAEGNGEQVGPLFTQPADETAKRGHEPVAYYYENSSVKRGVSLYKETEEWQPLYTAPPSIEAAILAEREACAKVCEQPIDEIQVTDDCSDIVYMDGLECASAIRARGEK